MQNELKNILFDGDENKPVCLVNERGTQIYFEQVFALEYRGEDYCILSPLAKVKGAKEKFALAFRIDKGNRLIPVTNEQTAGKIFGEYYKTLRKQA